MKNKPKPVIVGSVWESNNFGSFEVIEYKNSMCVTVRFLSTGFTTTAQASQIRLGGIKDLMFPAICGVGYIGGSRYRSRGTKLEVNAYTVWVNMINRCYNTDLSPNHPTYSECLVCDEWHNFQNFAEWVQSKEIDNLGGLYIDKDLKIPGNKIYSPQACIFVSRNVNNFTTDRGLLRGKYLIGVTKGRNCKSYISRCYNARTGKRDMLGSFSSEIEAHLAWRRSKSESARYLAGLQSDYEVRDAILTWKKALDNEVIHPYR